MRPIGDSFLMVRNYYDHGMTSEWSAEEFTVQAQKKRDSTNSNNKKGQVDCRVYLIKLKFVRLKWKFVWK